MATGSYSEMTSGAAQTRRGDPELLARIASGDRGAFRELYLAYHQRLGHFLLRFVRRTDVVEEIINDTMFTVWRKASAFRGESQVSTWILGIAYRQALKALRKAALPVPTDRLSDVEDIAMAHDAGAEQQEDREWLERGLATLPSAQRIVIELAYFSGHSCEEIALITTTPVNTVKTRLFHARERLRSLLPTLTHSSMASRP